MEVLEIEKASFSERLAQIRENTARIAGRLLLVSGLALPPTAGLLAESELPSYAATSMQVTGPNSDFTVTTECGSSEDNITTVRVLNKNASAAEAVLSVGDRKVNLHYYAPGGQRHKFATSADNMPITLTVNSPDSTSKTMTSDCRYRKDRPLPTGGYSLASQNGAVIPFGLAPDLAGRDGFPELELADIEPTPIEEDGFYLTFTNGLVFSFNGKKFDNLQKPASGENVVSTSVTTSGNGIWRFTDKGDVLPAGDASNNGSMKGIRLNGPILDSKRTNSGNGYWMIASDGGVFSFGDAEFYGSMGDKSLNSPVVGMAPTPTGKGYWLVAGDGGVFSFGDAKFVGSLGDTKLNKPIIGMVPQGEGYLLVASDGGVFAFNTPFEGSLGGDPPASPIVDIAPVPTK